jgi:hypothetical protein
MVLCRSQSLELPHHRSDVVELLIQPEMERVRWTCTGAQYGV